MSIFDIISPRSFTSVWYWIGLALVWSIASGRAMGLSWDLVRRARKGDADARRDLDDAARIEIGRIARLTDKSGLFVTALIGFCSISLILLGWVYNVEFFRALTCLYLTWLALGLLDLRWALRIFHDEATGEPLRQRLVRLHWARQGVALVAVLVTLLIGVADIIRGYILF
ncbi:hypothetical protein BVG79_00835 [Ketogulonicigenium robustum]|uniref:Component of SufBCD complex n=1 Tax=Ketogulonicigenium robustum TaxID=92947 RepID=A0A1W6NYT8_9RHOB|nr:hypothetical protein [Ketogulonicigenium robustum]ARO14187.1 hypothetical protein BVG79_00835 [Ketogulonicigenium robustum]